MRLQWLMAFHVFAVATALTACAVAVASNPLVDVRDSLGVIIVLYAAVTVIAVYLLVLVRRFNATRFRLRATQDNLGVWQALYRHTRTTQHQDGVFLVARFILGLALVVHINVTVEMEFLTAVSAYDAKALLHLTSQWQVALMGFGVIVLFSMLEMFTVKGVMWLRKTWGAAGHPPSRVFLRVSGWIVIMGAMLLIQHQLYQAEFQTPRKSVAFLLAYEGVGTTPNTVTLHSSLHH